MAMTKFLLPFVVLAARVEASGDRAFSAAEALAVQGEANLTSEAEVELLFAAQVEALGDWVSEAEALAVQGEAANLTHDHSSGTVYIIRHGEKDDHGCESSKGMDRANNMYNVFKSKFSVPKWVYAWKYDHGTCQRCEETAKPIAKKIGMSPDTHHGDSDCHSGSGKCQHFADAIKRRFSHSNPVLVVAEHCHIKYICEGLGVHEHDIPHWSDSDYDSVYVLKFSGGKVSLSHSHQGQHPHLTEDDLTADMVV